jgi:hypothetical protein
MADIKSRVMRELDEKARDADQRARREAGGDAERRDRARMEAERAARAAEMEREIDHAVTEFVRKHDRKPGEREMEEIRRAAEQRMSQPRGHIDGGPRRPTEDQAHREARAKEIFAWLKEHDAAAAEDLGAAMKTRPDEFWRRFPELVHHVEMMQELQRTDPQAFEYAKQERKLERESMELAQQYRKVGIDDRKAIESKLTTVLADLFDLREKMRAREIERLQKEIEELKERLKKRKELKEDIVRRRLNEMLDREDETDW